MNEPLKQDINFLEKPLWLQNQKTQKEVVTKWSDNNGYTFKCIGTPSKVDILFLYFLLRECQLNNWERKISVSQYQILKGCGMNPGKKERTRLRESLDVWQSAHLKFSGVFYDGKEYLDKGFHILEWDQEKNSKKLNIIFNKDWIQKIQFSEYFKYISFSEIKVLRSPLALRLYEILVKTFYKRTFWEIDVLKLAAKIPMAEKYFAAIFPKILAATKRIAEKTDLKISVKVVKQGRGKGKFVFTRQLEQTPKSSVKIPDVVFNLISKQHQKSCKKICEKILKKDGEDGLKYYICKTNNKKKIDSYGGYLKTLFDLDLYADFQKKQKKIKQAEKEEQEKIEKAFEKEMKKFDQRKTEQQERQDDQQRKEELIQNFSAPDLETFDEYILQQNLNSFEKNRFNLGKKLILRLRFVDQFVTASDI